MWCLLTLADVFIPFYYGAGIAIAPHNRQLTVCNCKVVSLPMLF